MDFKQEKKINAIKYKQIYGNKYQNIYQRKKNMLRKAFFIFAACFLAGIFNEYFTQNEELHTEKATASQVSTAQIFSKIQSIKIFDGDSFDATINGKKLRIRLYGIDSPEKSQAYGTVSRNMLHNLLEENDKIHLEILYHDQYKRAVSILHFENGRTVQEELLSAGLTWVYQQYCDRNFCDEWRALEKNAKNNKLGLWKDTHPSPPWQWRKKNKSKF